MRNDWHGLQLTTVSDAAVAAFDHAVKGYVTYESDTPQRIGRLMEAAPDFAMAHVFKGYMTMLSFKAANLPLAREALDTAVKLEGGLSQRERGHIAALDGLVKGNPDRALKIWEGILADHPTDIIAFRLHHFTAFWLGRPEAMAAAVESVLPRYRSTLPAYGTLLACRCFANEELGNYALAEASGRQAIEIDASDVWAAHAVAHILEMQGRRAEGILWLKGLEPNWGTKNNLKHHLWWHRGLYHFERGEFDEVLNLYDNSFRNHASDLTRAQPDLYIDIQNAASMLFRLALQDVDVGSRWVEIADHAETRIGDCLSLFTLPHWTMALAATKRFDKASELVRKMEDFGNGPGLLARSVRDYAVPVCKAIIAHGEGRYREACEVMRPALGGMSCLGGSHAQQEVLEQLFLDCAVKAGSTGDVRLIIERVRGRNPVAPEQRRGYAKAARQLTS